MNDINKKERRMVMSIRSALPSIRRFLLSGRYFALLATLGAVIFISASIMLGIPPSEVYDAPRVAPTQVAGVIIFVLIISATLVIHDDILAVLPPFLVLCVFACDCYNSFSVFSRLWWLGIPAVAAVVFHFVRYRMPIKIGATLPGIIAAGAAVLLGGLGSIPAAEYFAPGTLYYTLALSVGMVTVYLLLRPQAERTAEFDRSRKFAEIMYMMGIFVYAEIVWNILIRIGPIIETGRLPEIQQHNNFATFLLFALPYPFYFARRDRKHLLVGAAFLVCLFISDSRGGVLTAAVLVPFLILYIVFTSGREHGRRQVLALVIGFAALGVAGICALLWHSISSGAGLISPNEPRYRLMIRAIDAFKKNPIFGAGLGARGNTDIYQPKTGAFYWYHSLPLQLIGSLGSVGILAYAYQALARVGLVLRHLTPATAAMGLSYLGVFIMSCFNPGEFVPVPYELMVVATFVVIEWEVERTARKTKISPAIRGR